MKKSLLFLFALLMSATVAYAAGDGSKENPYSLEDLKAINPANNTKGWVKGYIVGWDEGFAAFPNVHLTADGATNDNIVLADAANEQTVGNFIHCSNNFIADLSIQNHADLIGKQVAVYGSITKMVNWALDMSSNVSDDFYFIEGGGENPDPTPGPTTEGDGTQEKPYTLSDLKIVKPDNVDCWVKGYVVGSYSGSSWVDGTPTFTVNGATDDAVLADTPDETDPENVMYVYYNFDVSQIKLASNPAALGKQVALKCKVAIQNGRYGINLSTNWGKEDEWYFIDNGGGEEPDPGTDPTPGEEGDGTEANPYTLEQVYAKTSELGQGPDFWFKGYLVGMADGSLSNWGTIWRVPTAQEANAYPNPIIAPSAECQDVTKSIVLFQCNNELLKLASNPEKLGKQFAIHVSNFMPPYYTATTTFDVKEITDGGGEEPDPGTDPGTDPVVGPGDGSKEKPYSLADLNEVNPSGQVKAWVKGYIVGWNAGVAAYMPDVRFSADGATSNNIVLADTPDERTDANLIYTANNNVADLGIKEHPEILGKQVAVYGTVMNVMNWSVDLTSTKSDEYYFIENGGGEDPDPVEEATEVTFDFTAAGLANGYVMTDTIKSGITLHPDKATGSNPPAYYTQDQTMRFYTNNKLTISTDSKKYNIVKVDFATISGRPFQSDKYELTAGSLTINSTTSTTWTDANGVKSFTITPATEKSQQVRLQSITVYLAEPGEQFAEAPVFSPEETVIEKNSLVTLTSATEGAKIYYTTDGKDPKVGDANTALYSEPGIMITTNTTIKAMATADGMTNSPVVTKGYMVPVEVKTLEDLMSAADDVNWYKITGALTVTYANGPRCFVKDNTASMLLYSNAFSSMELTNGTIITGIIGKYTRYLNMIPEFEDIVASSIKTMTGGPVNPTEATVADITNSSMSEYLIINNAVITKHAEQDNADNKYGKNYWTITDETGSQTLYNQFGIEIAETPEGKVADVVVIPSYYSNAIQLYAISYTEKDAPTQGGDLENGDGSEANPYTIEQVYANGMTDAQWFKGYLVGVAGGAMSNWDAVWGVPTTQEAAAFSHPIIAPSADCKDVKKSIVLYNCNNELVKLASKPEQLGKLFAVQAGQFMSPYNMVAQTFAVKELGGGTVGIDAVEADANAPVEYFNLQGMPVAADNLRAGNIYIRRQGGSVTKVLVK